MMLIFVVLSRIDISYGFQVSLKLSSIVLSWCVQDVLRYMAAIFMSTFLLGFNVPNFKERKIMLLMFYIFMLTATDFTNLMANIIFCELLAVICFLPLIYISLIVLA